MKSYHIQVHIYMTFQLLLKKTHAEKSGTLEKFLLDVLGNWTTEV